MNKKHFYKYLTISEEDRKWGVYLGGAGYTDVNRQIEYPLTDHPVHHYSVGRFGQPLYQHQFRGQSHGRGSKCFGPQEQQCDLHPH